ncbi:MAG: glycerol kinase GlpK [Christensenella sp.]|nr:glycerol kinase GlpK [Christensenella sp.]
MEKYVISLDQGTTSSRAIIFNHEREIVGVSQKEFTQIYPKAGWVEHDPIEIWNTQKEVMLDVLQKCNIRIDQIDSIGITNQRETTIIWDKNTGKPIYNAIVWQCRRTSEYTEKLIQQGYSEMVYSKTGLPIDPYFSGTKIKWILDNVDGAREKAANGELLFGTIDTWLMWKLSGGEIHATDYTNASRTMIYNIHTLEWDEELISLIDVPKNILPKVCPSSYIFGYTDEKEFGAKIPISGVAGDQQSALFGHLCIEKGMVKNTYGTGCFSLMNTGKKAVESKRGLITTLAASQEDGKPQYAIEGSVFIGGAVLQWLRDELKMISSAREADEISEKTPDSNGVYLVPAFVGLGAPHWDPYARGTVVGLTRGATKEHFVRAALESIAYQVFDVIHAMESDMGTKIVNLSVDGGASRSDVLMQFQSDILNTKVIRPKTIETTGLGAAYLAGLATGFWKNIDELKSSEPSKIFEPKMDKTRREELLLGWEVAIGHAKHR